MAGRRDKGMTVDGSLSIRLFWNCAKYIYNTIKSRTMISNEDRSMFHEKHGGGKDSRVCDELVEGAGGQERAFNSFLYRFPPTSRATATVFSWRRACGRLPSSGMALFW